MNSKHRWSNMKSVSALFPSVIQKFGIALLLRNILQRSRLYHPRRPENVPFPLASLPLEVVTYVMSLLSTTELVRLGATCREMRDLELQMRSSQILLSISPTFNLRLSDDRKIYNIDQTKLSVCKNEKQGHGYVVMKQPVNNYSTYWEIQLDRFLFHRCEVGVCAKRALTTGGLDKTHAWLFDCWGHKFYNHTRQEYGMKMRTGDILGVMYNKLDRSLSFFENGRNMGVAFTNIRVPPNQLVPFVGLPLCPGEQVTFLPHPICVSFPKTLAELTENSDAWCPTPHPDDEKVVVETLSNKGYRIPANPATTTVGQLKERLSLETGYAPQHIALHSGGRNLFDNFTLKNSGISFDSSKTQTQEVLFYISHEIS